MPSAPVMADRSAGTPDTWTLTPGTPCPLSVSTAVPTTWPPGAASSLTSTAVKEPSLTVTSDTVVLS